MDQRLNRENNDKRDPLDTLAYVVGSKYRRIIVSELASGPSNPTKLAEHNDVHASHVSRALGELEDRGVVSGHGAGSRTRLYRLTDHGEAVAELADDFVEEEDG